MAIVWVSEHSSLPSVAADTRGQLQRCRAHMYIHRRGFMLFVLDSNGVPSITQSVRTGRDLDGLGNWLNFPDFLLQGV
jgi:hypothetical protein